MAQMGENQTGGSIWWERLTIAIFTIAYLVTFKRIVPHGDALRIVRQIQDQHLLWNPNHLIFDPLGYAWHALLSKLGLNITALDSFGIISGISAVLSLLIFHALLLKMGVTSRNVRILAVGGLFASQGFLSMAISQYYFMVQMPFLLGALYFAVHFFYMEKEGKDCSMCLYGIGGLLAVAGTLMFNNVLLVAVLGLVMGFARPSESWWNYANSVRLWGAAASIGIPVFVLGYVLSDSNDNFIRWLLSYQGESTSSLNSLYGIEWSWKGITESIARTGFNLFSANVIENAGLGTVIRAFLFREPLEFVPQVTQLALAISLTPIVVGSLLLLLVWGIRHFGENSLIQFIYAWIGAYLVFNFLWSASGDLFWFQLLPVLWLLLMMYLGATSRSFFSGGTENGNPSRWKLWALLFTVAALLTVNTLQTVIPVSLVDLEARNVKHKALLRDGDLEVLPGWDGLGWMQLDPKGLDVKRLTLMDMALRSSSDKQHIQNLSQIIGDHLERGQRVIVARLYDKDHGINPWYGMTRLGWSRVKIQEHLSRYCQKEIGRVGDVVFREVLICPREVSISFVPGRAMDTDFRKLAWLDTTLYGTRNQKRDHE